MRCGFELCELLNSEEAQMLWWQPWGVCPTLTRVAQEAFELNQKKLTTELQQKYGVVPSDD